MHSPGHGHEGHPHRPHGTATVEKDPVCGMTVEPAKAAGSSTHQGHTYLFCSRGCLEKFRDDPTRYVGGPRDHPPKAHEPALGVTYTCPMHPEIVRDAPGSARSAGWPWSR
jgi:Cu+-exporting ATPase